MTRDAAAAAWAGSIRPALATVIRGLALIGSVTFLIVGLLPAALAAAAPHLPIVP